MEGQGTAPPPGFYDDGSGQQRWWDGTDWSEQRLGTSAPTSDSVLTDTSLTSKVLTVLFPLPALFIGLVMGAFGHRNAWKICRLALIVIAIELVLGFVLAIATGPSDGRASASDYERAVVARGACFPAEFVYRPHRIGISCDRTFSIRGIRWEDYGGRVAVGKGTARTQGCIPSCANGEVRLLPVLLRLHKLVMCGGRPVYARLTYRLRGHPIHGFLRHATLRMIATNEYDEPTCA